MVSDVYVQFISKALEMPDLCQQIHGRVSFQVRLYPLLVFQINKLSCAGADRLQTGMPGAFGKAHETVPRIRISQVIMFSYTKPQNKEHVFEPLHRAKFKFPGCLNIHISKKWSFTKYNAYKFEDRLLRSSSFLMAIEANISPVIVP